MQLLPHARATGYSTWTDCAGCWQAAGIGLKQLHSWFIADGDHFAILRTFHCEIPGFWSVIFAVPPTVTYGLLGNHRAPNAAECLAIGAGVPPFALH